MTCSLSWGFGGAKTSFQCHSPELVHPVILVIWRLIAHTNQPASVQHCIPRQGLCICELGPSLGSFFCATKCIGNKIFWGNPGNDDGRVWLYYFAPLQVMCANTEYSLWCSSYSTITLLLHRQKCSTVGTCIYLRYTHHALDSSQAPRKERGVSLTM